MSLGSIEGNGLVFLGALDLTVGANNLSTVFSGVIQDGGAHSGTGGSLTKIGTGSLTISGPNTYTGGTTVNGGSLLVTTKPFSGTGTNAVNVMSGTLGGTGVIGGPVRVGTGSGPGALLSPGVNGIGALTIKKALTFNADARYMFQLRTTNASADRVTAKGVTINTGSRFTFNSLGASKLTLGTVFIAINNASTATIAGRFVNLADGSSFMSGPNKYQASYEGGDGNDLTLTVIP
jgi:autotransporter-associated beta strand protein